jgi:hypothetical protein
MTKAVSLVLAAAVAGTANAIKCYEGNIYIGCSARNGGEPDGDITETYHVSTCCFSTWRNWDSTEPNCRWYVVTGCENLELWGDSWMSDPVTCEGDLCNKIEDYPAGFDFDAWYAAAGYVHGDDPALTYDNVDGGTGFETGTGSGTVDNTNNAGLSDAGTSDAGTSDAGTSADTGGAATNEGGGTNLNSVSMLDGVGHNAVAATVVAAAVVAFAW